MSTKITPGRAHNKPSGKLYLSDHQLNLVNTVLTVIELDTIPAGYADGIESTALHRITPGQAGFYIALGQVTFKSTVADKDYRVYIYRSDGIYICSSSKRCSGGDLFTFPLSAEVIMTVDQYLQLQARSYSGDNTVDIQSGIGYTFLSVQRVR